MGNQHASPESSKRADPSYTERERKRECDERLERTADKSCVLYNTPYLTMMFEKLAEASHDLDASLEVDTVSRPVFANVFNGPLEQLGKMLFDHICGCDVSAKSISRQQFLFVATDILSLMSSHQQTTYYFKLFSHSSPDGLSIQDAQRMVMVCYTVSLACAYLPYEPTSADMKIVMAFTSSLMGGNEALSEEAFRSWSDRHCPNFFNGVHCFLLIRLSGSHVIDFGWHQRVSQQTSGSDGCANGDKSLSDAASVEPPVPPEGANLLRAVQSGNSALELSLVWLLSCCLPPCYLTPSPASSAAGAAWSGSDVKGSKGVLLPAGASRGGAFVPSFLVSKLHQIAEHNPWIQLYNSDQNGLSTNRFETHVFAYKGPTLTLIAFESNLYLIACDEEWKESTQRWGKDDTMLIQLLPRFSVVQSGRGLLYMNHHNRGSSRGIFVGGKDGGKSLVLHIDEMTRVKHYGVDMPLQQVEVWGCGSSDVRDMQLRQRQWEHKETDKLSNRKLKLEAWEDNPDRQLLSWAGITTNHAQKT